MKLIFYFLIGYACGYLVLYMVKRFYKNSKPKKKSDSSFCNHGILIWHHCVACDIYSLNSKGKYEKET